MVQQNILIIDHNPFSCCTENCNQLSEFIQNSLFLQQFHFQTTTLPLIKILNDIALLPQKPLTSDDPASWQQAFQKHHSLGISFSFLSEGFSSRDCSCSKYCWIVRVVWIGAVQKCNR